MEVLLAVEILDRVECKGGVSGNCIFSRWEPCYDIDCFINSEQLSCVDNHIFCSVAVLSKELSGLNNGVLSIEDAHTNIDGSIYSHFARTISEEGIAVVCIIEFETRGGLT